MIDTVKSGFDFLKKLPKGLLAFLITVMPVACFVTYSFYWSEHSKNEKTSKILGELRIHTNNQNAMMTEINEMKASISDLYNYIDRTSLQNNNYIINQVGKKIQFVVSCQTPKQDFLIKMLQDWMDTETLRTQLEGQKIKQDSFNLSIGVRKK